MRIYVSGQITGTTDYMKRFAKAQKFLESCGHTVINPALVNSNLPPDTTYEEYMQMSLCMLSMCEGIYLLPGYENSPGALRELEYAKQNRIPIYGEIFIKSEV